MQFGAEAASVKGVPRWLFALVIFLVILPLIAAAGGQLFSVGDSYNAAGDLADIELHTRDVGLHQVELGQYSREDWSHPGPALFYALAGPYRLSGSNSIGANLGSLLINALSVVGILLLARRRGGMALLLTAAVGCAALVRSFGPDFLIHPWNPSIPVLPFALFLFLIWEITCGRVWAIPAAAAVGTFCVQTHIGYAPLVVPLGALAVAALLWTCVHSRGKSPLGADRRSLVRSALFTTGVLGVMWLPPVIQELRPDRGNLRRVVRYFLDGEGEGHTLADGYSVVALQFGRWPEWISGNIDLNPFTTEPDVVAGAPLPVLLLPYLVGALVWHRRRSAPALRLMAVTGVTAVLSVLAISRTLGPIYHYRLGWTRVVGMMALLSAAWALWAVVSDRWPRLERRALMPASIVVLALLAVAGVPRFARFGPPDFSDRIAQIAPEVERQLPSGDGTVVFRCDGDRGCIYLTGFVLWFERRGIDARVDNTGGVIAAGAPHRVYRRGPIRAVLHVTIDARFYARAVDPDSEVLSYRGKAPTAERGRIARELLELEADFEAERIDSAEFFFARSNRAERIGTAVGVVSEPFED